MSSPHPDGLPTPRRYVAMAAILAGIALAVLDGAIANVALPTISQALGVSPARSVWVVTSYQMALVMALLPCAAIGESIGFRRVFTSGVLVFTLASAACAFAPNLNVLIVARFFQGLGGAAVMAPIAGLIRQTYPMRQLGTAIGYNALTVALSGAAGPTLGAAILSVASWPWLFVVNLPVGALVLLASRALPQAPVSKREIDVVSVVLNCLLFGPLVIGVDLLISDPLLGCGLLAVALASLVLLVKRELPLPAPLIPLDLLRRPAIRVSALASVSCFTGQMASYVALPFYLQHALGLSAFQTGLYMTAWPLTVALAAPFAGRLSDRFSTAWLCAFGGICLGVGLALLAAWPFGHNMLPFVVFAMICGLGFGMFQTPNNRNLLLSAPRERSGAAGGLQSTARLVGQTAGAIIVALLLTILPTDSAPRVSLGIASVLAIAAGLISMRRAGAAQAPGTTAGA